MRMNYEDVDTKTSALKVFVQPSLWQQGKQWGCTLNICDAQVFPAAAVAFPF